MRKDEEVNAEIAKLRGLLDKVPAFTAFGESNRDAIEAEIRALENRWDEDDAWAFFGDDEENRERESAIHASWWLNEANDEFAPSYGWEPLAGK